MGPEAAGGEPCSSGRREGRYVGGSGAGGGEWVLLDAGDLVTCAGDQVDRGAGAEAASQAGEVGANDRRGVVMLGSDTHHEGRPGAGAVLRAAGQRGPQLVFGVDRRVGWANP